MTHNAGCDSLVSPWCSVTTCLVTQGRMCRPVRAEEVLWNRINWQEVAWGLGGRQRNRPGSCYYTDLNEPTEKLSITTANVPKLCVAWFQHCISVRHTVMFNWLYINQIFFATMFPGLYLLRTLQWQGCGWCRVPVSRVQVSGLEGNTGRDCRWGHQKLTRLWTRMRSITQSFSLYKLESSRYLTCRICKCKNDYNLFLKSSAWRKFYKDIGFERVFKNIKYCL